MFCESQGSDLKFQPLLPWTAQNASRFQWTGLVAGAFAKKETIDPECMNLLYLTGCSCNGFQTNYRASKAFV